MEVRKCDHCGKIYETPLQKKIIETIDTDMGHRWEGVKDYWPKIKVHVVISPYMEAQNQKAVGADLCEACRGKLKGKIGLELYKQRRKGESPL